jgi:hypothetical protein
MPTLCNVLQKHATSNCLKYCFPGTFWEQDIPLERYLSWFRYTAFWPSYLIIVINGGILRVGDSHSLASATRWWKLLKNLMRIKRQGNFITLKVVVTEINTLKAELNPICYLLALLGAHPLLHVSRIRVKWFNAVNRTMMWNIAWSEGGILIEELLMVMCRVCNSI